MSLRRSPKLHPMLPLNQDARPPLKLLSGYTTIYMAVLWLSLVMSREPNGFQDVRCLEPAVGDHGDSELLQQLV